MCHCPQSCCGLDRKRYDLVSVVSDEDDHLSTKLCPKIKQEQAKSENLYTR